MPGRHRYIKQGFRKQRHTFNHGWAALLYLPATQREVLFNAGGI